MSNFRKITKDIKREHNINVYFDVDNNGHVWMFDADTGTNINIAVRRNRGYSQTGQAKGRLATFAKDDARRYIRNRNNT